MNDKRIRRLMRELTSFRASGLIVFAIGMLIVLLIAVLH